jgi:hypothetical protein
LGHRWGKDEGRQGGLGDLWLARNGLDRKDVRTSRLRLSRALAHDHASKTDEARTEAASFGFRASSLSRHWSSTFATYSAGSG